MAWQWSRSTNRYRDTITGKFVSRTTVLGWVADSLGGSKDAVATLAEMADPDNPVLSPGDWRNAMREQVKGEYIRQYMLGRGGRDQMTQRDWGNCGFMIKEQYQYLENFLAEVEAGELSMAQLRARSQMYINSAREAYERAQAEVAGEMGMTEVKWNLTPAAESCDDCVAYDAMGWQSIADDPYVGCTPGSGCSQCGSNCQCFLEYR